MPTATLTFQLPEEREDHQLALDGWRYRSALHALDERLRSAAKHGLDKRVTFNPALARQWLWDAVRDQGIEGGDLA